MEFIASLFRSPSKSTSTPQRATSTSTRYAPYPSPATSSPSTSHNASRSSSRPSSTSQSHQASGSSSQTSFSSKSLNAASSSSRLSTRQRSRHTARSFSSMSSLATYDDASFVHRSASLLEAVYEADCESDTDTEYVGRPSPRTTPEPFGLSEDEARTEDGRHYIEERRKLERWQRTYAQDGSLSSLCEAELPGKFPVVEEEPSAEAMLEDVEGELNDMVDMVKGEREMARKAREAARRLQRERDEEREAKVREQRKARAAQKQLVERGMSWCEMMDREREAARSIRQQAEEKLQEAERVLREVEEKERAAREEAERLREEAETLRAHDQQRREWKQRQEFYEREEARKAREAQEAQRKAEAEEAARQAQEAEAVRQTRDYLAYYEHKWSIVKTTSLTNCISFGEFPWPVFASSPTAHVDPAAITPAAIKDFIFHDFRPADIAIKTLRDKVRVEMLRYHPDKFNAIALPKIVEADREKARDAVHIVSATLTALLSEC